VLQLSVGEKKLLNQQYLAQGALKLPSCLAPPVLQFLNNSFNQKFVKSVFENEERSTEFTLYDRFVAQKIHVIFNAPDCLKDFSELIGTEIKLARYRLFWNDSTCRELDWHDDSYENDGRVAGIRYELSSLPYQGGAFEFEDKKKEMIVSYSGLALGEAVLFKVEPQRYFHRVSKMIEGKRQSLVLFLCL